MGRWDKVLTKARDNPAGLRFSELKGLAKRLGFYLSRQRGSHEIYLHENSNVPLLNVQPGKAGAAKPYQVQQLLDLIAAHKLTLPGDNE